MDTHANVEQARRMVDMFVTGDTSDLGSVVDMRYLDHQGLSGSRENSSA
jgi:hypothetical protein